MIVNSYIKHYWVSFVDKMQHHERLIAWSINYRRYNLNVEFPNKEIFNTWYDYPQGKHKFLVIN